MIVMLQRVNNGRRTSLEFFQPITVEKVGYSYAEGRGGQGFEVGMIGGYVMAGRSHVTVIRRNNSLSDKSCPSTRGENPPRWP